MIKRNERRSGEALIEQLNIIATSGEQVVNKLSGGNQQKVVVGKWLASKPKMLIVDEPTRGVDVGAKAEIHRLLSELAQQGLGILMIFERAARGAGHERPHPGHAQQPHGG